MEVVDAEQLDGNPRIVTACWILPTDAQARCRACFHAFGAFVVLVGFERMTRIVVLRVGVRRNERQKSSGKSCP